MNILSEHNATRIVMPLSLRRCRDADLGEPEETHHGAGGSCKLHRRYTNVSAESIKLCAPFSHVCDLTLCVSFQFRWFSVEVLQEMDNNVRLDKDYISVSEG